MTQYLPDYERLPSSQLDGAERSHYASTWFKVAGRQDRIRLGQAVVPDVEGYREIVVATEENRETMPLVVGICLRRCKKNQITLIATSGMLPREWTGLPQTAGNVTVATDGTLELEGTGPSVGRANDSGTLFLRLSGAVTTEAAEELEHIGFDGVDVQENLAPGTVYVRASRDLLVTALATGQTDNWLPGASNEWITSDVVLVTTDGASPEPTVTGFYSPGLLDTRSHIIVNSELSPGSFTIEHLSASSDSDKRVVCPDNTALVLQPGDACRIDYIANYWRVVATTAGAHPYTGVDGVDVTGLQVRSSRDIITASPSGVNNDYNPTGWDTCDILFLTVANFTGITGFAAPAGADSTVKKIVVNDSASTREFFLYDEQSGSAAANRIVAVTTLRIDPGSCAILQYMQSRWYAIAVSRVPLPANAPGFTVGATGATGTRVFEYALEDHVHAHGSHSDGTNHAELSSSGAGFGPSTSGHTAGELLTVQGDGSSDWEPLGGLFGLNAIENALLRVAGGDDSTWEAGTTDFQSMVYVPGWERWVKFGVVAGATNDLKAAVNAQSNDSNVLAGGQWDLQSSVASAVVGPFLAVAIPINSPDTYRVVVGHGTASAGTAHIATSDDGAFTWSAQTVSVSTTDAPTAMVWSGSKVVVGFPDGTVNNSSDGQTYTDRTPSLTADGFQMAVSDRAGVVLLFNDNLSQDEIARSADDGDTWASVSLPTSMNVTGAAFANDAFYIFDASPAPGRLMRSDDLGLTWTAAYVPVFSGPSSAADLRVPPQLDDTFWSSIITVGDYLLGAWFDNTNSVWEDLFYSEDGVTWHPAGHQVVLGLGDWQTKGLFLGKRQFAVMSQNGDTTEWLSQRYTTGVYGPDAGATGPSIYLSLPEAVGAVGATGASILYAPGDHVHPHGSHTDGSDHAEATSSGAGFAPSTSGASAGDVLTVQGDLSVDYETPATVPTPADNTPQAIGAAGAIGSNTTEYALEDHVHNHGAQSDGSMHAEASFSGAGFAPGTSGVLNGELLKKEAGGGVGWSAPAGLIRMAFDSATTMSQPATNAFRFNNSTLADVTQMAVRDTSVDSYPVAAAFQQSGQLTITIFNDELNWNRQFQALPVKTDNSGWTLLNVNLLGGTGNFVNGTTYNIAVHRTAPPLPADVATIQTTYEAILSGYYVFQIPLSEIQKYATETGAYYFILYGVGSDNGHGGYDDHFKIEGSFFIDVNGDEVGFVNTAEVIAPSAITYTLSTSTSGNTVLEFRFSSGSDAGPYAALFRVEWQSPLTVTMEMD